MNKTYKNKFKYSPGMLGYGVNGIQGERGLLGMSLYISNYSGSEDNSIIRNRIINNESLLTLSINKIPGYPYRVYKNDDLFIDKKGNLYKIDFSDSDLYTPYLCSGGSQCNLGFENLFIDGPIQTENPKFSKYINEFQEEHILIDTVYSNKISTYIDNNTIYDNSIIQYGNVFLIDQSIADITNNSRPYNIWNTLNDILAMSRSSDNTWSLGKKTEEIIDNIDLALDFSNVTLNDISTNKLSTNTITTDDINVELDAFILGDASLESNVTIGQDDIIQSVYLVKSYLPVRIYKNSTNTEMPIVPSGIYPEKGTVITNSEIKLDRMFDGIFIENPPSFTAISSTGNLVIQWIKTDFFNTNIPAELNNYKMSLHISKIKESNNYDFEIKEKETIIEEMNDSGTITITDVELHSTYNINFEFQYNGWVIISDIKTVTI